MDGSNNNFTYEKTSGGTIPFGGQGDPLFIFFTDAFPNEPVEVDITQVDFILDVDPADPNCSGGNQVEIDDWENGWQSPPESDDCTEQVVELIFGSETNSTGWPDINFEVPLQLTHSASSLSISDLDFSIRVDDIYGNVLGITYVPPSNLTFNVEIEPSGQGYNIYGKMTEANPDPFFSLTGIGTLVIERPSASNEKVSVLLSYEYGRIRNETDEECCQPELETGRQVDDGGEEPCSAYPMRVQPTTQIPGDGDACLLYYDIVLTEEEIEVNQLRFTVYFEFDGEVELIGYSDPGFFDCEEDEVACPGNNDCISIVDGNKLEFAICSASPITIPEEATLRLTFEASEDGDCVSGARFIHAYIQLPADPPNPSEHCVPDYQNTEEEVCLDRVTGTIKTELGDPVGEADVSGTQSCENSGTTTECDGTFAFCPDCPNQDMLLVPEKDDDADCGVTTYDMVLITRHILTTALLDSPYKIIAADANHSGTVSTLDLVAIRKVILYIEESFPNNTSWRFVDASYSFPNPANPFQGSFPEFVQLDRSTTPTDANFIGVKIGDVNLSCTTCNGDDPETESLNPVVFEIPDKSYQTDDTIFMAFSPDTTYSLAAFQLGLKYDDSYLTFLDAQTVDLSEIDTSAFNLDDASEGKLRVVWVDGQGIDATLSPSDKLFRYRLIAKSAISDISQYVSLDDEVMLNLAYDTSGLRYPVQLGFNTNLDGRSLVESPPSAFSNLRFWPNPAENILWVQFQLDQAGPVSLRLSDISGNVVWQRELSPCASGAYTWKAPLNNLPPGIYFANLNQEVFRFVKK
ncbi:MAG: T9SS type A sorting domain-containing protein [Saprospiraceae bacterium]